MTLDSSWNGPDWWLLVSGMALALLVGGVAGCDGEAECAAGTWDDGTACVACDTGTFSDTINATMCTAWTVCQPGSRVDTAGSATADRTCLACEPGAFSETINATACTIPAFSNGQMASVVIGQPDFTSGLRNQGGSAAANTISSPLGSPFVDSFGTLFLPDFLNHRVLVFGAVPEFNNADADAVIGQPNFVTTANGTSATYIDGPRNAVVHNGKLLVAEADNHRIAIYNTVPTTSPGTIDVVVGNANKDTITVGCSATILSRVGSVAMAGDRLVVADETNHRVLIWNSVPTTDGQPADLVLGQASFVSCLSNRSGSVDADTMNRPLGVFSDGERLIVVDSWNNRALIWSTFPTTNGQAADLVLGQADFTGRVVNRGGGPSASTVAFPSGAYFSSAQLFITDSDNSRVLIWNGFPTVSGQAADIVLGQPDFTTTATARTRSGLGIPSGVFLAGKQLIVADGFDSRYLVYSGL